MTDNEIIKALNYCCGNIKNNDEECNEDMYYQVTLPESRDEGTRFCRQWLIKDALDLINRQKAEIERLREIANHKCQKCVSRTIECAKSEAMKEFAERLKTYAKELHIGDNISWLVLGVGRVDQLVKEMTEVNENV